MLSATQLGVELATQELILFARFMANQEEEYPALRMGLTLKQRMKRMEIQMVESKMKQKTQMKILYGFCERDVIILVGEILKWCIKNKATRIAKDDNRMQT